MARHTRSTPWLGTIAAAALLLSGCASATAEPAEPAPQPSHTMPDGTVMSGAEHGEHAEDAEHAEGDEHHATDGERPSAAAEMVCGGQVVDAAAAILSLEGTPTPSSSWQAPDFTCTFDVDGAPLTLTVHDVTDAAAGQAHFDELQQRLGAEEIDGMLGLGLPSFSTGDGVVGFLRDGKTLTVDATALPDGFGDGSRTQDGAAYAMASAVLTCWVEHD